MSRSSYSLPTFPTCTPNLSPIAPIPIHTQQPNNYTGRSFCVFSTTAPEGRHKSWNFELCKKTLCAILVLRIKRADESLLAGTYIKKDTTKIICTVWPWLNITPMYVAWGLVYINFPCTCTASMVYLQYSKGRNIVENIDRKCLDVIVAQVSVSNEKWNRWTNNCMPHKIWFSALFTRVIPDGL